MLGSDGVGGSDGQRAVGLYETEGTREIGESGTGSKAADGGALGSADGGCGASRWWRYIAREEIGRHEVDDGAGSDELHVAELVGDGPGVVRTDAGEHSLEEGGLVRKEGAVGECGGTVCHTVSGRAVGL